MAKVGAQRAAVLTGKSKSTIQRAMKSGKLSYSLDQNNRRVIDVSELERVFGVKQESLKIEDAKPKSTEMLIEKERLSLQVKLLEQQLETAQDQIEDLKDQRDKWEKQASQVLLTTQHTHKQIEDLRAEIHGKRDTGRIKTGSSRFDNSDAQAMKKLRPENQNDTDDTESASRFLFWKKAKV